MAGAGLFTWLQDAAFYRGFHAAAADLMGAGDGRSWLDAGCGPGVLARLAAARGFVVRGVDRDSGMIASAGRLATDRGAQVTFATSDLDAELARGRRYDVVSASSLIVVTSDPEDTLVKLCALTAPGGRLLVIEASPQMSRWRALKLLLTGRAGPRGYMFLLWATGRSGRALPNSFFEQSHCRTSRHPLLGGLVNAWVFEMPE